VVSAFETLNDAILERLDKGHTAADAAEAVETLREHGIEVRPSFLPFTPWTERVDVEAILDFVVGHDLVASVDPVQYTIRLLLPSGSLLLDHPDLTPYLDGWDATQLTYRWHARDPEMDDLQRALAALVEQSLERSDPITATYALVRDAVGLAPVDLSGCTTERPRLTESWFCCAEPTATQRAVLR
jgi:hypothetical protein